MFISKACRISLALLQPEMVDFPWNSAKLLAVSQPRLALIEIPTSSKCIAFWSQFIPLNIGIENNADSSFIPPLI